MKKILSSVLCLAMLASMSTTAFAAVWEPQEPETTTTNTHELIYQNDASYEISIPATSNIDVATGRGAIEVAVTNAKLEDGTMVAITASSTNYNNGTWNLVNSKNDKDTIAYSIGTTSGANDIATSEASDAILYVTVSDTDRVGTFTDTITFTSEIVEAVSFIDFTVQGIPCQAEKGMTWSEWYESDYFTLDKNKYSIVDGYFQRLERESENYWLYFEYCDEDGNFYFSSADDEILPFDWII